MKQQRRGKLHLAMLLVAAASPVAAYGADPASKATIEAAPQWSGFYVGGHAGYGFGSTRGRVNDPAPLASTQSFGSYYGGLQGGYNVLLPSGVLLGVEADASFPNYLDPDNGLWGANTATSAVTERIDFASTLRGRLGYASGPWLLYGTAGLALSQSRVARTTLGLDDDIGSTRLRSGWTAGAGAEWRFEQQWSLRLEYLYSHLGPLSAAFPSGTQYTSRMDMHMMRVGLNYWPWLAGTEKTGGAAAAPQVPNWEFHGQTTYVQQAYPAFRAPYSGANSLSPFAQSKETLTASAFIGVRLWQGGELHYNGELLQGFGLSETLGAGGYPNGEAQKSGFTYPRYNTSRLYVRQTFGFGGEQEDVESAAGQLGGKRDISRLSVQVGKFSIKDTFDSNAYSSDPRVHFLNWSIWAAGAFDYPADRLGLTYGAVAEFNQKDWAVRTGYFLVGDKPNSNNFDALVLRRGGYLLELETRYTLLSRPGKLRLMGWLTNTFSGGYRDAVDLAMALPGLDPTDAIVQTRRDRIKYGYVVNLEQSVTDDVGLFGRWSWNNGKSEISAFTDIDSSLSGGVAIKGTTWGRPTDTIGIAGAINALSTDHRDYTAAGGLGVLIGDGRLNYRTERVFETYYAVGVTKQITVTLDYQHLVNPAYNADRGPVHIFAARLHGEI